MRRNETGVSQIVELMRQKYSYLHTTGTERRCVTLVGIFDACTVHVYSLSLSFSLSLPLTPSVDSIRV